MTARGRKWITVATAFYAICSLLSMVAMSIGSLVLLVALLAAFRGPRGLNEAIRAKLALAPVRRYLGFSAALAGACVLSLVVAALAPLGYGGLFVKVHFLDDVAKLWYLAWPVFLLVALGALDDRERARVWNAWLIAFGVLSVIGIAQFWTGWPRPRIIPEYAGVGVAGPTRYHATLFLGHHLSVASVFIFPFFAALSRRRSGLPRAALALIAAAGAGCLFFTYSRTLWVALPAGFAAWVLLALPRRQALAALGVAVLAGIALTQVPGVSTRLHAARGTTERTDLWEANWQFFKARPLTGVGWHHNLELAGFYLMDKYKSSNVFTGHAHDNALDFLGGTGLLGLAAWIAWCVFVFQLAWRADLRGFFCAWIVFQINGITQVNFWEGKVLHQVMWMVAWLLLWNLGKEARRERV